MPAEGGATDAVVQAVTEHRRQGDDADRGKRRDAVESEKGPGGKQQGVARQERENDQSGLEKDDGRDRQHTEQPVVRHQRHEMLVAVEPVEDSA